MSRALCSKVTGFSMIQFRPQPGWLLGFQPFRHQQDMTRCNHEHGGLHCSSTWSRAVQGLGNATLGAGGRKQGEPGCTKCACRPGWAQPPCSHGPGLGMAKMRPAGLPKGLDGQEGSRGGGSNGISSPWFPIATQVRSPHHTVFS